MFEEEGEEGTNVGVRSDESWLRTGGVRWIAAAGDEVSRLRVEVAGRRRRRKRERSARRSLTSFERAKLTIQAFSGSELRVQPAHQQRESKRVVGRSFQPSERQRRREGLRRREIRSFLQSAELDSSFGFQGRRRGIRPSIRSNIRRRERDEVSPKRREGRDGEKGRRSTNQEVRMKCVSDLISSSETERVGSIRETGKVVGDAVFYPRQSNGEAGREEEGGSTSLSTRRSFCFSTHAESKQSTQSDPPPL